MALREILLVPVQSILAGIPAPYAAWLQNKYIAALLIFLIFLGIAKLIQYISRKYLERWAAKTKTTLDDVAVRHLKRPVFYLIVTYGLKNALLYVGIDGIVSKIIDSAMALVFLLIVIRVADLMLEFWSVRFAKKTKTMFDDVLLPLFHKITKVLFVLIGFLWVLKIWQIDITPYLAGVGIGGLVLGLALQDSLRNVLGGISLILDKNFNVGDPVKLESGELGVIKDIGLRSTKMLTYDNEIIFIPNGQLANMKIHNFVRPNARVRKIVDFSVEYGSDPEKVKKAVLSAMKKINDIYDEPYMDVIFVEMADFGMKFKARFWADWGNAYDKWVEATQVIYAALHKAKIGIPFPTHTVYLKDAGKEQEKNKHEKEGWIKARRRE